MTLSDTRRLRGTLGGILALVAPFALAVPAAHAAMPDSGDVIADLAPPPPLEERMPAADGPSGGPAEAPGEDPDDTPAPAPAKPPKLKKPPDPRPKSATIRNPWYLSAQVWVRNYVMLGAVVDPSERVGPFVSGLSPSIRMGESWRFDLGVAWSSRVPHLVLYPGFRQFWFPFMWISFGFIVPIQETLSIGVFGGPGFRWWITPDLAIFFEATPNYLLTAGGGGVFVLNGVIGVELGLL